MSSPITYWPATLDSGECQVAQAWDLKPAGAGWQQSARVTWLLNRSQMVTNSRHCWAEWNLNQWPEMKDSDSYRKKNGTNFPVLENKILKTGLKVKIFSIFLSLHTIGRTEIRKMVISETFTNPLDCNQSIVDLPITLKSTWAATEKSFTIKFLCYALNLGINLLFLCGKRKVHNAITLKITVALLLSKGTNNLSCQK